MCQCDRTHGNGSPYIAMEYLEGGTLREALQERGALPVSECAEIIQQVARGLNAAHKLGIIHRDLKPDNIFLTPAEEVGERSALPLAVAPPPVLVKLVDFGIAKLRESATHTLTGTVLGTPAYMSFEQAAGMRSDELDVRSDIYSLGVVVYEMLTGRVPFHSDTPLGCVRKHLTEEPPPFRAVKPDMPSLPQLERVVMKALTKDRELRYSSALEFARELEAAARTAPLVEAKVTLPATRIIQPAAPPPLPYSPPPVSEPAALKAETPVQLPTLPPPPPKVEPAVKSQPVAKQPPAVTPPAVVPKPPQFPTVAEPATMGKYIVLSVFLVAVVVAGIWYWLKSGPQRKGPREEQAGATTAPPSGMVYIPASTFMMGRDNADDPEETPAHTVSVSAFYIDTAPVTNAQFAVFVDERGTPPPPQWPAIHPRVSEEHWPVTQVTWHEAQAYCQWKGGRLPTEAEWEYAARGTDGRLYPWGNNFDSALANSLEAGLGHPQPVGSRIQAASPFGVLDMSGNVWQWCDDDYKPYPGHEPIGPSYQITAHTKAIRGGSFKSDKDHVTTTTRNLDLATARSPAIGFRCAKSM